MALAIAHSKPIRLILALVLVFLVVPVTEVALTAEPASAQPATFPDCKWGCTANDVSLTRVYLAYANGTELGPCTEGGNVTAYIWADFLNNTASDRYAVWMEFDLWRNGTLANSSAETLQCDIDLIPPGAVSSQIWGPMEWECGRTITIRNLIISWVGTPAT